MQVLQEGQRFERYRIQRCLSSSVSGTSYEVEDTLLLRKVTLKLIHPWATLPDAARRQFFREMQGISTLIHPYLATVLDYGEVDGQLYIARRYVTPGSLLGSEGRYWFRPPLDISDAIHYSHQLAEALQYIHNNNYLHGALTFANILVLRGASADKGPDFAPFLLADVGTTHFVRRFGRSLNTLLPITAAPEQLGKRVTPASDQYALAVILYFWLTGRPPFLGTPEEIEQLKLTETITTLTALNLNVPLELEGIIRRALSVYPEERYPSILTFADMLQASIAHPIPVASTPVIIIQTEVIAEKTPEPVEQSETSTEFVPETVQREEIEVEASLQDEPAFVPAQQNSEEVSEQNEHSSGNGADQQYTWALEADQFFQEGPLSLLELLSMGALEPEPKPQPVQPTQPVPPTQPMQPAQTEPLPQVVPDVPQPLPDPAPIPEPLPETPQQPAPGPKPDPDILPPPAPDIPQPIPEPKPIPPAEPAQNNVSPLYQDTDPDEAEEPEELPLQASVIITSAYTEKPQEIILEREETTLGHAGSSDILLDQGTLTSRHHALLRRESSHYCIYDLHSTNGVIVNGQKIAVETGYELKDGDYIIIGEYELTFCLKQPRELSEQAFYQSL